MTKSAPGFDKDHWPLMADYAWANDLHRYYDTQPRRIPNQRSGTAAQQIEHEQHRHRDAQQP